MCVCFDTSRFVKKKEKRDVNILQGINFDTATISWRMNKVQEYFCMSISIYSIKTLSFKWILFIVEIVVKHYCIDVTHKQYQVFSTLNIGTNKENDFFFVL